jgi:hypothetical protein
VLAEHDRRMELALTLVEKNVITQWRLDKLSRAMTDHHARIDGVFSD